MNIHIGTSGWSYDHWQDTLYPPDLPARDRLSIYTQHFDTVELNSSYYHWPRTASFQNWQRRLPQPFLMSVKASRTLTHFKRLYQPEEWLAAIAEGVGYLGEKRGVLLVQLPPQFAFDYARLAYFLEQLPTWLKTAVEFRHPSWHQEAVFELLEHHQVAYCIMSGAHLPCVLRATAPFVYVRLHGPDSQHLYGGSYSDDDLRWWAARIQEWGQMQREVFVYFNNDGGGNAVCNAWTLREMVG
jgi:uncharacterized protein YecE (DUF72 family)